MVDAWAPWLGTSPSYSKSRSRKWGASCPPRSFPFNILLVSGAVRKCKSFNPDHHEADCPIMCIEELQARAGADEGTIFDSIKRLDFQDWAHVY